MAFAWYNKKHIAKGRQAPSLFYPLQLKEVHASMGVVLFQQTKLLILMF